MWSTLYHGARRWTVVFLPFCSVVLSAVMWLTLNHFVRISWCISSSHSPTRSHISILEIVLAEVKVLFKCLFGNIHSIICNSLKSQLAELAGTLGCRVKFVLPASEASRKSSHGCRSVIGPVTLGPLIWFSCSSLVLWCQAEDRGWISIPLIASRIWNDLFDSPAKVVGRLKSLLVKLFLQPKIINCLSVSYTHLLQGFSERRYYVE